MREEICNIFYSPKFNETTYSNCKPKLSEGNQMPHLPRVNKDRFRTKVAYGIGNTYATMVDLSVFRTLKFHK